MGVKIKKFYEAIIDYESENIKKFYEESLSIVQKEKEISFDNLVEIGKKNEIEIVDYETFISELPDKLKKAAPQAPIFGLVNPKTNKIRIVLLFKRIKLGILNHIYHIIKHENIHIGQASRREKESSEYYDDVRDKKAYYSNKDEIMAFSQTISDMILSDNVDNLEDAKKKLRYNRLWSDIKNSVDEKVRKRYIKYIYLYLEKELSLNKN